MYKLVRSYSVDPRQTELKLVPRWSDNKNNSIKELGIRRPTQTEKWFQLAH